MEIIKKIKLKLCDKKNYKWYFFGFKFLEYNKFNCKKYELNNSVKKKNKTVCYLKVNRIREYTLLCIQNWLNVLKHKDTDIFIICDNKALEKQIQNNIIFPNTNVHFIKSNIRATKKLGDKIAIKKWRKAAYAHLTTYFHAHKNGYKSFWNIDADDTIILSEADKVINLLNEVESYSESNNIDNFSLDMWRSYTESKHWTFGITYTRNCKNWLSVLNKNFDNNWYKNYEDWHIEYNLDWFFTYLKDYKNIKNETFYIENCSFIHYGAFLAEIIKGSYCKWSNGKIIYPIITEIFKDKQLGILPIAKDCIQFDVNISDDECLKFLQEYVGKIPGIMFNRKEFESKK